MRFAWDCWGHGSGERKPTALQQLDCVARTMHQCTVFWVSYFANYAEALDRWSGKSKHRLISYFLSNTSTKSYRNRIVYLKIIASRRWDVFELQCTLCSSSEVFTSYSSAASRSDAGRMDSMWPEVVSKYSDLRYSPEKWVYCRWRHRHVAPSAGNPPSSACTVLYLHMPTTHVHAQRPGCTAGSLLLEETVGIRRRATFAAIHTGLQRPVITSFTFTSSCFLNLATNSLNASSKQPFPPFKNLKSYCHFISFHLFIHQSTSRWYN